MKRHFYAALCAGVSTLAVPAAVRAADAPAAQGDATSLQEIVVTASRSESTAQKTPVALTAYTGADLAQKGVSNVLALASVDASLNVSTNGGASYVAIRGIASTDVTETGDPSVPISRDNFFTNRSFSIATSMYDLERVEVLKGPQGTLFGRNSTGGLVQVITKKPGDKLSADASLEYGAYNAVKAEAGVSLPLSDKVQLRVAGFYSKHDGYRAIDVLGGRGDDDDTKSGRITLTFQPFDGLKGLIQYQHDDVHNTGDVAFKTLEGVAYSGQPTDHFANYAPSYNALVGDRVRWEFSYDLPANLTLFYAGGYDHQKWRHSLDASSVTGTGALAGDASSFRQEENPSTWNHEIRLATPQNGKLTAQVGYFHFSEHNGNLDSGLYKNSGTYEGQYLIHFLYDVKTRSDGVFGQFGWRPIDPLHITAGMRYTWDSKERTGAAYLRGDIAGFLPSFITTPIVTPGNGNVSEAKPTFHIGADWTFTPHSMAYAKFDTGFKSGGFNSNGSAPSVNYGPETLKAWEMGTKNKFLGGHLMVNADAFYQQYNGYQASQNTGVLSGSASGVFNVGAAEIYGMEAQLAVASHGWRLDANGTALKTRFTTHSIIVKGDNTTTVDLYGKRLPNAPTFVLTAGLEYGATLAGAKVTPRIEWKHSSSFYFDAFNDADVRQGQYDTFNASVMVKPGHSPFELMFFVRNLTNKSVYASAQENFVTIPNAVDTFEFQPPRTYGVRAAVHF